MVKKILTKKNILKKIKENKEKIKSLGVKKLWLFGSYAKNEQTEKSDIDFLVEFEKGKSELKILSLGVFLEKVLKKEVDLGFKKDVKKDYVKHIINENLLRVKI